MLRILTYHRIGNRVDCSALNPRLISATPDCFREQVAYLARYYDVVSMADVVEALQRRRRLSSRSVLITFDDAYVDFKETAWPILREFGLPATLFVPTAYPDHPERGFWWDRLWRAVMGTSQKVLRGRRLEFPIGGPEERHAALRDLFIHIKNLPHAEAVPFVDRICAFCGELPTDQRAVLNWDELRELARQGVTLGGHTRSHPILTRIPLPKARSEIRGSYEDLRSKIGQVFPIFCYPNGAYNETILRIMREEGFLLSLTTEDGFNDLESADPLRLRRINITPRTTLAIFRLRLLKLSTYVGGWRHHIQRLAGVISRP